MEPFDLICKEAPGKDGKKIRRAKCRLRVGFS